MPGQVPPKTDERELLLAYVAQQREGLRNAAHGLSDEQARRRSTVSALSIGGLIKHAADVETSWIDLVLQESGQGGDHDPESSYEAGFKLGPGESLTGVLAHLDAVAARTEAAIAGIADLGQAVPVPKGVPWFPDDVEAWSVRWVLLHLVEELARHAGHADVIRESIDGATMYELMAAVEGWPATEWLQPWEPAA